MLTISLEAMEMTISMRGKMLDGVTSLSQILETIILKVTKAFGMMEVERISAMRNLTLKI